MLPLSRGSVARKMAEMSPEERKRMLQPLSTKRARNNRKAIRDQSGCILDCKCFT